MTPNRDVLLRPRKRPSTDRVWWLLSMWVYAVAGILKILGASIEKPIYWVLVGIFATLQALYWQREADHGR